MRKKLSDNNELMYAAIGLVGAALLHLNSNFKRHIDDCTAKSTMVIRVVIGVLVVVLAQLILNYLHSPLHLGN